MIATEEEAKTKRCQESFGDGFVSNSGMTAAVPANPYGHGWSGGSTAATSSPSFCIGSACMAWRWMPLIHGSLHEIAQPRTGYCGKAGKP